MNSQNIFVANRIREVLLNGKFIANTNFKEQVENISWKDATLKVYNLNSIALLTFHINYYLNGLIQAFMTGSLEIKDRYSFDMPEILSEHTWQELLQNFLKNAEAFASIVEAIPNEKFEQDFVDPKYGSLIRNLEAVIEHSYYHLGQVVLIKKIINNS